MLIKASKSELTVRVETTSDGRVIATSVDLPDLQSQAASRAEALSDLETKIRARLVTTEIVTLQWDTKPQTNPWLDIAGKYATDPEFDRMLAHIEAERELIDRAES
jgi:predicted nucleic acid-binding Zn ribbon protein